MVTQDQLKEVLDYNPDTGVFIWRVTRNGYVQAGSVAGSKNSKGYINIKINKKMYLAHRLAWLYVHGFFPPNQLDHINRTKDDNRINNLRMATHGENQQNYPKRKDNKSGSVGVHWEKLVGKWRARIQVNGVNVCLGFYDTIENATAARVEAKARLHTFNPRT